jgi:hypothetical protein
LVCWTKTNLATLVSNGRRLEQMQFLTFCRVNWLITLFVIFLRKYFLGRWLLSNTPKCRSSYKELHCNV